MSPKEKIDVLMHEYNRLREEILQRERNRFASMAYLGAIAVFLLTREQVPLSWKPWLGAGAVLTLVAVWLIDWWLIGACATRITEIEQQVNRLAEDTLLVWDSRHVVGRTYRAINSRMRNRSSAEQPEK